MKKYFIIGGLVAFVVIFNLGYLFHEILMGDFFRENIGHLQREEYILPLIAFTFVLYIVFQAYFFPIYYGYAHDHYKWPLTKTAVIFGAIIGFFWDGLQGGMIEVASLKMPAIVFWVDSGYHTAEGIITALILSFFYHRFFLLHSR
jgi:hypothetical protein